jgi:hypothetical protein
MKTIVFYLTHTLENGKEAFILNTTKTIETDNFNLLKYHNKVYGEYLAIIFNEEMKCDFYTMGFSSLFSEYLVSTVNKDNNTSYNETVTLPVPEKPYSLIIKKNNHGNYMTIYKYFFSNQ